MTNYFLAQKLFLKFLTNSTRIMMVKYFLIGFISKKEFQSYLVDKYILDYNESQILSNTIFKNENQNLNFAEFAKIIRPNMGQDLVNK